jgi:hypothetical protein
MYADLAGLVGGLMTLSDTCGEEGRFSSEISESSPDDETGPSLTSMALAAASVHTLEV